MSGSVVSVWECCECLGVSGSVVSVWECLGVLGVSGSVWECLGVSVWSLVMYSFERHYIE